MKLGILRWIGTLVVAVMMSGPAFAAGGLPASARVAQTSSAPAQVARTASAPAARTTSDAQSYAARETQSAGLEQWKGGAAGIYIGGSALALALLLVILLVLL
jgi:hypothetical protein